MSVNEPTIPEPYPPMPEDMGGVEDMFLYKLGFRTGYRTGWTHLAEHLRSLPEEEVLPFLYRGIARKPRGRRPRHG
jgi:hypothetical protein